jgi:hypothetical protein
MAGGGTSHPVHSASRPLRASLFEGLERPFAQLLLGTLLPLLVLALLWDLAPTLSWKAFYLAAAAFGCAVSFLAWARRRHSMGVQAWLAGIRASLVALTLPWVLFVAVVATVTFVALLREVVDDWRLQPGWWLAIAVLPVFSLIALPSLSTLTVLALGSRQAWRAARAAAPALRWTGAALGLITPLALGLAVEFVFRSAEARVIERYVESTPGADPSSLVRWRTLAKVHGWTTLEARCGYGKLAGNSSPDPEQQRARATLEALTGFEGGYLDEAD